MKASNGECLARIHPGLAAVAVVFHLGALAAFWAFTWEGLITCLVLVVLVGQLGIGLGYHRLLCHRSYHVPKPLRYFLALMGLLAFQGRPLTWCAIHRLHHRHSDHDGDPQMSNGSFWWSHMLWALVREMAGLATPTSVRRVTADLHREPFLVWLERWQHVIQLGQGLALLLGGWLLGGWWLGVSLLLWGFFLRVVAGWHATFLVNSINHHHGYRNYETDDNSTNCWWVALLTFGEGWHNNHHAQPRSAAHGHRWFEIDTSYLLIRLMERLGLATRVVRPKRSNPSPRGRPSVPLADADSRAHSGKAPSSVPLAFFRNLLDPDLAPAHTGRPLLPLQENTMPRSLFVFAPLLLCLVACLPARPEGEQPPDPPSPRQDLIPKEFRTKAGRYQPTKGKISIPEMPRDKVICFCLYTTHRGVLKLNTQLYPLTKNESRKVQLHLDRGDGFKPVAEQEVDTMGWSTVFRVEKWDDTKPAKYRVTHEGGSTYEGVIRRNPIDKPEIVVGNLSCNSSTDRNPRADLVANLKALDPDLLFFAGDQSYDHKEHLAAWLLFGRQFGEVIKDRPTVTIPDDHDVGHPNLWGAGGKQALRPDGADGGYFMPVEYVNMVQRQQCGHLPDPHDPTPVARGITVYYTSLNVGGIDFAILEDRKWKSGPLGLVDVKGPRPDHVTDPAFDPRAIDVPEAELLGARQLKFLREWGTQWEGTVIKCVLSQTPFANGAHLHGGKNNRLVADLDSNGWPQAGRNAALREIRRSFAFMMSGDQHLSTVIHHGVNDWGDSGWQFTSPSIWNLYGRWWMPLEKNTHPYPGSSLPMAGNYHDGFGNLVTMAAYANPTPDNYAATGFGLVRFRRATREITMECWPRFVDVTKPGATQFPGWPLTIKQEDNYARQALAWLPTVKADLDDPVIQVIDETSGEVVYTLRIRGREWQPKTFRVGPHTVRVGIGAGKWKEFRGLAATKDKPSTTLEVSAKD